MDNEGVTTSSDYGRLNVSSTLYEGTTSLTDKYVNESGDSMSGSIKDAVLSVTNTDGADDGGEAIYATAAGRYGNAIEGEGTGDSTDGVYGYNTTGKYGIGVRGVSYGAFGFGVYGYGSQNHGVVGWGGGSGSRGVYGRATNTGDVENYGGWFQASGQDGRGVYGEASHAGDVVNYGGYFEACGENGRGVYGYATDPSDVNFGGYFEARGKNGRGVYGEASHSSDVNFGGYFMACGKNGRGVYGYALSGIGVYGCAPSSSGIGVYSLGYNGYAGYFLGDVHVTGTLTAHDKQFVQPHPIDPSKQLVYVCLEGGENGVYLRGSGQLENGRADIELPEHFALAAAKEGLTAQVTPRDGRANGYLYVEEAFPDRIVVAEAGNGTSNALFDYLVMGVRRGFEEHEVIQTNEFMKPDREISQEEYEEWLALPKNKGMQKLLIENGTLTPEGKLNLETAERLDWELGPETKAERMEKMMPKEPEMEEKTDESTS